MHSVALSSPNDFAGWRAAARRLIEQRVSPELIDWNVATQTASLFDSVPAIHVDAASSKRGSSSAFTVPKRFLQLAAAAALHTDPNRFALLYRLLWRLKLEPRLLDVSMDSDVQRIRLLAKAVQRDMHKMKAFVRFRRTEEPSSVRFIAWFEPSYYIVEVTAPFFARRFANESWAILTPERSAYWDTRELAFGPGAHRSDAPTDDSAEALWRDYYASIFNPARLKIKAMKKEMPQKYWNNLPESSLIPQLIESARERTQAMIAKAPTAKPKIKRSKIVASPPALENDNANTLGDLRDAAKSCERCPLYKYATQTVFGEGPKKARVLFVGEQPGDREDLKGKPFVGPAGQLLDRALAAARIERSQVYVTNAVKHFKYELRGKRRMHKTPAQREIIACNAWLQNEIRIVKPDLIVLLGATAVRAVLKKSLTIERNRGVLLKSEEWNAEVLVTVHPSYLLRIPDDDKELAYSRFVADLRLAAPFA